MLEPGRNVRFALMAEGQDPDDLLKSEGADGFARVLAGAVSLIDMLWMQKLREFGVDRPDSSPTQRAAFWDDIRQIGRTIAHNQTRSAFLDDIEFRIGTMRDSYRRPGDVQTIGQQESHLPVRRQAESSGIRLFWRF